MTRRTLNLLTALSLLLCVAVAALWFRGRAGMDAFEKYGPRFGWGLYLAEGEAVVTWSFGDERGEMIPRQYAYRRLPRGFAKIAIDRPQPQSTFDFNYFRFRLAHRHQTLSNWTAGVPYWFLCLALAAGPAWHAAGWRRRVRSERARRGLCPRCGYDLRATPDRCPECGEATA